MRKEEAIKLIVSKYPNRTVDKVTETEKYFLISVSDKESSADDIIKPVIYDDGLKAVEKSTGKIFTYNPIRDSK